MTAVVLVSFLFLCFGEAELKPLIPHFNCKKIAYYKTHKTGSTTLGGVLSRVAMSSNMSLYTTRQSHYISLGFKENTALLGASDVVLHHIRHTNTPNFHAAARAFYGRALGTSDFGFLTILRHPVDRYISDFYYYVEPDARKAQRPLTLQQYVVAGGGANRMAGEFSVRSAAEAVEFVAGEVQADGLFLPLELLDYGLVLLAAHCGWRLSQLLYLPVNTNKDGAERYDSATLSARPTVAQLAKENPALVDRIAALNGVDSILYGAAYGHLLSRLQQGGRSGSRTASTSASALMSAAVRLMAARKQLEAQCRTLHGQAAVGGQGAPQQQQQGDVGGAEDLAGLCAWYSMPDTVYERMPSPETGRVGPDEELASPWPGTFPSSWRVVALLRAADVHFASYEEKSSLPYYHSLLAVRVHQPAASEVERVYGLSGADGGSGEAAGGDERALLVAIRLWAMHHAREGLHHLVFLIDSQTGPMLKQLIQQTAAVAVAAAGHKAGGDSGSGGGGAVAAGDEVPYTTVSVVSCGTTAASADAGGEASSSCDSAELFEMVSRSRWSAVLPGLTHFMYGTRGSVRSVLLWYESTLPAAGAICAPLVPWRTAPPGVAVGWFGGGSGGGGRVRRGDRSGRGRDGGERSFEEGEPELQGSGRADAGPGDAEVGGVSAKDVTNAQRRSLSEEASEISSAGLPGPEDPDGDSRRLLQQPAAAAAAADGSSADDSGPLCLRAACSLSTKDTLRCVMVRAMPLLGRTQSYLSDGQALPEGRSSYRVWYRGPEQQRLEVARLGAPCAEDVQLAAEAMEAGTAFRCSRVPRPRLRVPWCS